MPGRLLHTALFAALVAAVIAVWSPGFRGDVRALVDPLRERVRRHPATPGWIAKAPEHWGRRAAEILAAPPEPWVREIAPPGPDSDSWGYKAWYAGRTANVDFLDIHYSTLGAGLSPHKLHRHDDEELILPVAGEAEILRADRLDEAEPERIRLAAGQLVYHAPNQAHTIEGAGDGPAGYVVVRWSSREQDTSATLPSAVFDFRAALDPGVSVEPGFAMTDLFEGPTRYLEQLHAHSSTLEAGAGYPPHADSHDVVIIVFDGEIETLGRRVQAPAVAFCPAYRPHGMHNPGARAARYLVIELHGGDALLEHE